MRKYKKVSCHKTKTAATKKAKGMRNSGKTASVRKSGSGYCVYSAGASKTKKARVSGTKRRKTTARRRKAA